MRTRVMRFIICVCVIVLMLFCAAACVGTGRDYHDDLVVALSDTEHILIIKEWSFLLGSGADIYYQIRDARPILLGTTTGGDDGACPFSLGQYEVIHDGSTVTLRWRFSGNIWREKEFILPNS
ncbi:MAG: hypothetical protein J6S76_01395 [Clostridia bacterium]|nr:hypothetical protein [Clostridia bacterium]